MIIDGEQDSAHRGPTGLDRARVVSQALADAARLARVSRRSRRALSGGGFQARRGARLVRWALFVSFILTVALPTLTGALYFAFIASDQYEAEAKFTVFGGAPPTVDSFGSFTGIPAMAIVQDTQIVTNYIHSVAAVERLDQDVGLKKIYSDANADRWSRFNPSQPIEKFVKYWSKMSDVSISLPAGIVDLKVRAFSPDDAARIANAVLSASESLINELNTRMDHDAVTNAEAELQRTSERLVKARLGLQAAQNDTGLIDVQKTSEALGQLITTTREALLNLQQQYTSELRYVSVEAPQMKLLKSRIDATSDQISDLESKITSQGRAPSASEPTLATSMTRFAELDLERQVAERLYAGAAASLEIAHLIAEQKMMYLNTFVQPVAPQEAQYPRRLLNTIGIALGSFALWCVICGLGAVIRNNKA